MSRLNDKLNIASRTGFHALEVEDIESDSGDDVIETSPTANTSPLSPSNDELKAPPPAPKPSKSSLKKAAKAEKRLKTATPSPSTRTQPLPNSAYALSAPEGSLLNPLPVVDPTDEDSSMDASYVEISNSSAPAPSIEPRGEEKENPTETYHSVIEVIGPDGGKRSGNVEILVSSSEPHVVPPVPSAGEVAIDATAVAKRKHANVFVRSTTTLLMIGGFIGLMLMGHIYMIILVFVCQTLVYREITSLFALTYRETDNGVEIRRDPWSKTLNWYFFTIANYFLYGETIIYYFKHIIYADVIFLPFATNHRFISFTLYCIGFVGFVTSLQKNFLKRQFSLFGWVHMTLLLIVVSSHFIINNILEGLIWFWLPASLVVCNDVWAYIWGVTTGRTPLIAVSPKKTVEGFVGAVFSTLIFGFFWGTFFMQFDYMICPVHDLGVTAFSQVTCKPNPVFVWREWPLPFSFVLPFFGDIPKIAWAPYQFHVLVMATFASLVAPFGGFFASGFKRAFNIKDFGDSIPGHGGMTDRMDCQFLMGMFSYVYFSTTIRQHNISVGSLLQMIVSGLTLEEQMELFNDLRRYFETRGIDPVAIR